jgi:adenylylsulfate kinase-like enzyme
MKTVILLRSVSGAGKSTLANLLASNERWVSVCADDYFTDINGNYNFDASKLGEAHRLCQENFMYWLDNAVVGIIVANTSTKERDFSFYENAAKEAGAMFISLVVENRHGNKDIHNVPQSVREMQAENIKNSLLLL